MRPPKDWESGNGNLSSLPFGMLRVVLTWAALWATFALVLGTVIAIVDPDSIDVGESPVAISGILGRVGLVSAFVFLVILALAEKGKGITQIPRLRLIAYGALASAALPLLTAMNDVVAINTVPLGVVSALVSISVARAEASRMAPAG